VIKFEGSLYHSLLPSCPVDYVDITIISKQSIRKLHAAAEQPFRHLLHFVQVISKLNALSQVTIPQV
jgi:hypothetical protein